MAAPSRVTEGHEEQVAMRNSFWKEQKIPVERNLQG
jgi:hypothetical protein